MVLSKKRKESEIKEQVPQVEIEARSFALLVFSGIWMFCEIICQMAIDRTIIHMLV